MPAETLKKLLRSFLLCSLAAACAPQTGSGAQSVDIALAQDREGSWRLEYRLTPPVTRLDLGPSLNGFRSNDWRLETPGLKTISDNGRDYIIADGGAKAFRAAAFEIHPHHNGFAKQYEPITPFADGGAIIYTGHFWPFGEDGGRVSAVFDIAPRPGAHVAAFGQVRDEARRWASPFQHPAFLYVGPLTPTPVGSASAVIDPAAPDWIAGALAAQAPPILAGLAGAFGRDLDAPPDMFLVMDGDEEPGRLRYSGDALPGQFMIRLAGGAWDMPTPEARRILLTATAHEAAHLWQMRARPRDGAAPAWIHEGGADALAAELVAALGAADRDEGLAAARGDCRAALAGRSLAEAEAAGDWPASYACGRVLAEIAARAAAGGDVAVFWRDFIARAKSAGGYDEALFYLMIEERAGSDLAAAVRRFPRTPLAAPDKELARLLDEAER